MNQINQLRVATYSRVSTSHHNQNPEVQVHKLRRYCQSREWVIQHEIVDHGFSGGTTSRPGLCRLFELVETRQVDVVVVVKMDRLFRSLKHLVTTLEEWHEKGIQFVATKDSIDYTTPAGRLMAQILGSLAEFEKGLLKERTLLGLEHAKRNGKVLGRPKKRNDDEILRLRSMGLTYSEIQKELNIGRGSVFRAIKSNEDKPETIPE